MPLARRRGHTTDDGVIQVVERGRRGYGIVDGPRPARRPFEIVIERGVARRVGPGSRRPHGSSTRRRSRSSASRSRPTTSRSRSRSRRASTRARGRGEAVRARFRSNVALVWLRDGSRLDLLLSQARATSYGIDDLSFVTRSGVRMLLGRAAGIVVALLVAFSLVALGAAGIMLGASASSEVQRRLPSIGVERALGFSRRSVVGARRAEGALVAAPAGRSGSRPARCSARRRAAELLESLNELGPGSGLLLSLIGGWPRSSAIVAAAAAWPAWRAARRPSPRSCAAANCGRGAGGVGVARRRRAARVRRAAGRRPPRAGPRPSRCSWAAGAAVVLLLALATCSTGCATTRGASASATS